MGHPTPLKTTTPVGSEGRESNQNMFSKLKMFLIIENFIHLYNEIGPYKHISLLQLSLNPPTTYLLPSQYWSLHTAMPDCRAGRVHWCHSGMTVGGTQLLSDWPGGLIHRRDFTPHPMTPWFCLLHTCSGLSSFLLPLGSTYHMLCFGST